MFEPTILHCKAILDRGLLQLNEMNFVMKHAPGAGSIAQPVDLQSSVLPLCYSCTHAGSKIIQITIARILTTLFTVYSKLLVRLTLIINIPHIQI